MVIRDHDLFDLANSVAQLLGAPVTIEDQDNIVIAYSGGEQDIDEARIGTILSRQVPPRFQEMIAAAGVYDHIRRSDAVVYVDLHELGMKPRAVVAVRVDGRTVGSIWAAVADEVSPDQDEVLRSAAPLAARHIVQGRDRADAAHLSRVTTMAALLGGGEESALAASRSGLRGPMVVAAVVGVDADLPVGLTVSIELHLAVVAPRSVCATIDGTLYAVLVSSVADAQRILEGFISRSRARLMVVVGIGREVTLASRLDVSRREADLIVQPLAARRLAGVVATMRSAYADVLATQLANFVENHSEDSPLTHLERFDRDHGDLLVESVDAYLQTGGDVADAAKLIHVHPNTLRNRLRRAKQSSGVDVTDLDTRLALMIHLRIRLLDGHRTSDPNSQRAVP